MLRQAEISAPNQCWFCKTNNVSSATSRCLCTATTLPTKFDTQSPLGIVTTDLAWDIMFPLQGRLSPTWRAQAIEWFRRNDGMAIRVGEREHLNRVMFVRDHMGERTVSWDSKTKEGKACVKARSWDEMAEVRGFLEGMEGGDEFVEGMEIS